MSTIALYYPNVTIVAPRFAGQSQDYDRTDLSLLTTAALLWDAVEVIVPFPGFHVSPVIGTGQNQQESSIREAEERGPPQGILSDVTRCVNSVTNHRHLATRCEMSVEIGLELKAKSRIKPMCNIIIANGNNGYHTTAPSQRGIIIAKPGTRRRAQNRASSKSPFLKT